MTRMEAFISGWKPRARNKTSSHAVLAHMWSSRIPLYCNVTEPRQSEGWMFLNRIQERDEVSVMAESCFLTLLLHPFFPCSPNIILDLVGYN